MAIPDAQREVAAFLAALSGAAPIETHISLVFLGPDTVWKLKKSVALSFLDFSTIEARRRFCLQELELNAPAALGLYRDVVPILRGADGGLLIGGIADEGIGGIADEGIGGIAGEGIGGMAGEAGAVDWVLRMARVPAEDFLDRIAARGALDPPLLDRLADTVAAYHQGLPPVKTTEPAAAMRRVLDGNLRASRAAGLDPIALAAWQAAIVPALDRLAPWLGQRGAEGFVRRGHGDLHLGNLCLWQGRPVPFDALEFDEDLATIDVGYDLAFLLMDLDQRVGRPAANQMLNRAIARTGDAAMLRGLPVFLSLRAIIRAHVEAARGNAAASQAYLTAAILYLEASSGSVIIAIGGLPGTGKSTLARALAPELGPAPGALVARSDEIRKRLHGVAPEVKLPSTAYSEAVSTQVFAELAGQAETAARAGHAVIADATFLDPRHRAALQNAAAAAGVRFLGIWLQAPLDVLSARIARRNAEQADASDATPAILHAAARAPNAVHPSGKGECWIAIPALDRDAALAAARKAVMSLPAMC